MPKLISLSNRIFAGGLIVALLLMSVFVFAQPSTFAGQINLYTRVLGLDPCTNSLQVADTAGFAPGTTVLLLQFQGAAINEADNATYGQINSLNGSGLYELNTVQAREGMTLFLSGKMQAGYQPAAGLQLVQVPVATTARIIDTVFASAWNGQTGGVVALMADTLVVEAPVVANGSGFRGAVSVLAEGVICNSLTFNSRYYYAEGNWRSAPKGEGMAEPIAGKEWGRGAQASGGGGGNNHNSGGGGGGGGGTGGRGGENDEPSFGGCDGFFPGEGGKLPAAVADARFLWPGGGGGAGHRNNNTNSSGGAGGGVIFLKAQVVIASGGSLQANGQPGRSLGGDGGGGGGGGGTIVLFAAELLGDLPVSASGGAGGSVNNGGQERCMGPGGGGGGGRVISSLPIAAGLTGGTSGITFNSASCAEGTNAASAGQAGLSLLAAEPVNTPTFTSPALSLLTADTLACANDTLLIGAAVEGTFTSLAWQWFDGNGFVDVQGGPSYLGIATAQLTLAPGAASGAYRLLGSAGPDCPNILSDTINIALDSLPQAQFTAAVSQLSVVLTNMSTHGVNYLWDFGDGNQSSEISPLHIYEESGAYTVTLIVSGNCGQDMREVTVVVGQPPSAEISFSVEPNCSSQPTTVRFSSAAATDDVLWQWLLPGAMPSVSADSAVQAVYNSPGIYEAKLILSNAFGSDTALVSVVIPTPPTPNFAAQIDGLAVAFTNLSQNADQYNWNFGDGNTSQQENPVHVYAAPGIYDVSLNAQNAFCGIALVQRISVVISSDDQLIGDKQHVYLFPNPVSAELRISGWSGGSAFLWDSSGRLLRHWEAVATVAGEWRADLATLPAGSYHLGLSEAGSKRLVCWRIVKLP